MTRDTPAERMTTRIGIATGYDPALDVRDFARTVHEVDERGYDIAFFSETFALMRDSVSAMADRVREVQGARPTEVQSEPTVIDDPS